MKSCSLLLIGWMAAAVAYAQSPQPGGVPGAIHWYGTDTAAGSPGLRSLLAGSNARLTMEGATLAPLNFHPALLLSGRHPLQVDLGTRDLRSASYFTVYQSLDTAAENSIWHISSNGLTTLVLTTDRMADLSVYQYMNYRDVVREQPKVNVYVQHRESDSLMGAQQWWNIGVKPAAPRLPIVDFKGLVPEIIAYDRLLNNTERLQVASYLALKYGITLTEPGATYLNSAGDKIWDGYDYSAWHRNIAGIGRDDSAGLYQLKASSSNTPGLLTLSTQTTLPNDHFLLWGDNGKPLTPAPTVAGLPLLLQKTWLVKPYGNGQPFTTDLVLDTRQIDAALPVNAVYWLAIDPTGEGAFASAATRYVRMDRLDKEGRAHFNKVPWDMDGSGRDVWGIIAGQELLLASVIGQPACAAPGTGSLQVRILGGQGPYRLQVHSSNGPSIDERMTDGQTPTSFTHLSAGKYWLTVTDAAQRRYSDSFYINSLEMPQPAAIAPAYTLAGGRPLRLDASPGMPDGVGWAWSGPDGFSSGQPQVMLTEPGLYTLRCSKDGCVHAQDLQVKALPANALYNVTVYPNPSPAVFNARITLDRAAPVTLAVYGPDGRLVSLQKGDDRSNYLFTGELTAGGTYELVFTSGLSKTTKRLVVAK
jgi:hypothetical protein